jgi:tRNA(Ile)-lysidine synthase
VDLRDRSISALREAGVAAGDRIVAAVSGGADSLALVHLLAEIREQAGIDVVVVHVDHGLRTASGDDARFVEDVARDLGLRCEVVPVSVRRAPRTSLEAAAREVRYEALEAAAERHGCAWIATAHTLDDQAETVLLRVIRDGTAAGLRGILPVRGRIVRPLLGVRRQALRDWLRERGVGWREDETNDDTTHERNWIRHVLLPQLTERRAGVVRALDRLAQTARIDDELLDAQAGDLLASVPRTAGGVFFPGPVLAEHPALVTRAIRRACAELGAPGADPRPIDALRTARPGALVERPGILGCRTAGGILLLPGAPQPPPGVKLPRRGMLAVPAWGLRVRVGPVSGGRVWWRWGPVPAGSMVLRTRRPGDRVRTPVGSRKVQDVLVDAKVPRPLRDLVPILATPDRALAVVGFAPPPVPSGSAARPWTDVVVEAEPLGGEGSRWWIRENR